MKEQSPPKKKMPLLRAVLMMVTALFFSVIILIFSTLPFTLPLMVGVGAGTAVSSYIGSGFIANTVGTVAGTMTGAVEVFTGADVAVAVVGEVAVVAINIVAWCVFYFWLLVIGIKLTGNKRAVNRFFINAGSFIAGMIPFINILPTVLIGVTLTVLQTMKEDYEAKKEYEESFSEKKPAQTLQHA